MNYDGTIADRFDVGERVGSGGMGVVYRAHDRATGRPVAVKLLRSADEHAEREAAALAKLEHPGIVGFVAAGTYSTWGERYLAMEYLDGETLGARFARVGLTVEEAVALGIRIGGALGEAHARRVKGARRCS
ncbi:MAG: hypothetical protein EKK55_13540 [Rhodocyclaceae bacterium]|nr:MAG: hypothetical protein EKK55_13540 [Rhodocyclaceae bacterium]